MSPAPPCAGPSAPARWRGPAPPHRARRTAARSRCWRHGYARRENSGCGGFPRRPAGTPAPTGIGAQRRCDRVRHLPLQRRIRLAAEIAGLDRKGAAFAGDDRRVAEQLGNARAVQRRRHHQNAQILAQTRLRVARQRQADIGIERTFVKFVEQHGGDAGQFGIVENLAADALGDDLHPRGARTFNRTGRHSRRSLQLVRRGPRHPFGAGPAAIRRGSSMMIFLPSPAAHRAVPAAPAWSCRRPAAPPAPRRYWAASVRASSSSTERRSEAAHRKCGTNRISFFLPGGRVA